MELELEPMSMMDVKSINRFRHSSRISTIGDTNSNNIDNCRNERQPGNHKCDSRIAAKRNHSSSSFPMTRKIGLGFFAIIIAYLYLFKVSIENFGAGEDKTSTKVPHGVLPPTESVGVGRPVRKEQLVPSGGPSTNSHNSLAKLRPIDREQYTVRINTWRRPEQLIESVRHHASCPGAKQIQIVWCDKENDPPRELVDMTRDEDEQSDVSSDRSVAAKVVIEHHEENSLNERFNVLIETPTLGILSIDDDVLRPCDAIDSGFFKWVRSPHRMVGFDARTHVENDDGSWKYGYLSTTKKENRYSLSLTRYCFLHKDYMARYTKGLPQTILDTVAKNFNCEDIAMSFMVSSQTRGQPPLLADLWAIKSQIKLDVPSGISGTNTHKELRDECVDTFAAYFGLKENNGGDNHRMQKAAWIHKTKKTWGFACGAEEDDESDSTYPKSERETSLERTWERMRHAGKQEDLNRYLVKLVYEAGEEARAKGLLAKKK